MTLIGPCDAFDAIRRTAGQVVADLTAFRRMTPALRLRHARPLADALDAYARDLRAQVVTIKPSVIMVPASRRREIAAILDGTPPTPKGEA